MNYEPFLNGFKIIKNPYPDEPSIGYKVISPRKAEYLLFRHPEIAHLFYVTSTKSIQINNIRGQKWFSDAGGFLDAHNIRYA